MTSTSTSMLADAAWVSFVDKKEVGSADVEHSIQKTLKRSTGNTSLEHAAGTREMSRMPRDNEAVLSSSMMMTTTTERTPPQTGRPRATSDNKRTTTRTTTTCSCSSTTSTRHTMKWSATAAQCTLNLLLKGPLHRKLQHLANYLPAGRPPP